MCLNVVRSVLLRVWLLLGAQRASGVWERSPWATSCVDNFWLDIAACAVSCEWLRHADGFKLERLTLPVGARSARSGVRAQSCMLLSSLGCELLFCLSGCVDSWLVWPVLLST